MTCVTPVKRHVETLASFEALIDQASPSLRRLWAE
jgi:hypothetical protein